MFITKRKEISDYSDIIKFIEKNNDFHDMRIGGLDYDSEKGTAKIFLEEVDGSKKISEDDVLYQYIFEVEEIERFRINSDIALRTYVMECLGSEDQEITLALTNGEIVFKAKKIRLSVPTQ